MSKTRLRALLLSLLILGGLLLSGSSPASTSKPDKVEIEVSQNIFLTLTDRLLVQQLYDSLSTLSPWGSSLCTLVLSEAPIYQLTFSNAGNIMLVATAQEGGCPTVTKPGFLGFQQGFIASSAFWNVLERALSQAFSSFPVQRLAIGSFPSPEHPGRIALLSSTTLIRRLYEALLNLPVFSPKGYEPPQCQVETLSENRLLFSSESTHILVFFSQNCERVTLGKDVYGIYKQWDEQFQHVFAQTLEQSTFTQAEPTQLIVQIGTNQHITITDLSLIRKLYETIFSLPKISLPQQCSSQQQEKSTSYTLSFSQGNLPILTRYVTAGACNQITVSFLGTGSQLYFWQGNETFWKLLQQITT